MTGPRVVKRFDARPLRAQGIHPVEQVLAELAALGPGEAYELVTPHVPGPILEKAARLGVTGTSAQVAPDECLTTFVRGG